MDESKGKKRKEEMRREIYADSASGMQYGIQDPATPIAEGIINFHHDLMIVMVFVVVFVGYMMVRIVSKFEESNEGVTRSKEVHGTVIEIIWTIIPALTLMVIAVPSFTLLYAMEEVVEPEVTVKVVGHQWYWSYEYSDIGEGIEYDSYMIEEEDLNEGELRLLEVDNRIVMPVETHVRIIVTSADVIHSWAVPAFGIKIDACPGRLNEISTYVKRPGVYYGQCSELCGVNHAFMPIGIEVVSKEDYIRWIIEKSEE